MIEKGLSAPELALRVGASYEHIRKLIRGWCLPSNALLGRLCSALELNKKDMAQRVRKDKIIFRFGDAAWEAAGHDSRTAPFYILVPLLSLDQWNHLRTCIQAVAAAKHKAARVGTS